MKKGSIIWVTITSAFIIAILLRVSIYRVNHHQKLAYAGDVAAAKRIILPCWKPLLRGLAYGFIVLGVLQIVAYAVLSNYGFDNAIFIIVQEYGLCLLIVYCIPPTLLAQSAVSVGGFYRCFYFLSGYFLLCNIVWVISKSVSDNNAVLAFEIIFWICTFFPVLICCIGLLSKRIQSRIQLGSASNRSSIEFLVFYCIIYGIFNITVFATNKSNNSNPKKSFSIVLELYMAIVFISGIFFPFAFYRSLLADTKFWRGLGKHNQGGIRFSEQITSGDLAKPTIELAVVGGDLQSMISTIGEHLVIDFALLQIKTKIGDGATAEVYNGIYKNVNLAIKISTPPEVTPDVIDVFASEANVTSSLNHPNIVKFYGICIRPPQIAMVVELCSRGNLKNSLVKYASDWTDIRKCKACLDAAKSLEYLHAKKLIHRDVKAANYFVGENWDVKLGDFGESTAQRSPDGITKENRMEILGTVAFMAPELVAAKVHYTEAVDNYAMAIMMWEIWTGGGDPFDDVTTFQIYELVGKGKRPDITRFCTPSTPATTTSVPICNIPDDRILDIMQLSWHQEVENRLTASEIVTRMTKVLYELYLREGMQEDARALIAEPPRLKKKMSMFGDDLLDEGGSSSTTSRSSISFKEIYNTISTRTSHSRGSIVEFRNSVMDVFRGSVVERDLKADERTKGDETPDIGPPDLEAGNASNVDTVVTNPLQL